MSLGHQGTRVRALIRQCARRWGKPCYKRGSCRNNPPEWSVLPGQPGENGRLVAACYLGDRETDRSRYTGRTMRYCTFNAIIQGQFCRFVVGRAEPSPLPKHCDVS